VFAGEPLLEVTAPIAEAQLAETMLLNHITFQTGIASKAARCVLAARGAQLVDFSFRRTQSIEAGLAVARASAIAGFTATSNTEAARRYGLAAAGTMAHSYVEAFGSEEQAFTAFATDFPGKTTFLVDTYDTEQGVRAAIEVAHRLRLPGPVGVRLDSGDLAALAVRARRLLDDAGLPDARIFASGSLDEHAIAAPGYARRPPPSPARAADRNRAALCGEPGLAPASRPGPAQVKASARHREPGTGRLTPPARPRPAQTRGCDHLGAPDNLHTGSAAILKLMHNDTTLFIHCNSANSHVVLINRGLRGDLLAGVTVAAAQVADPVKVLQSLVLGPGTARRSGPTLRDFLRGWVGPAIVCGATAQSQRPRHMRPGGRP
jgi:Nicotinate phosphoribosyltransferase (NAPRTase) family